VFQLSRGPANFVLFEPRRDAVLVEVGDDPEPATGVNREASPGPLPGCRCSGTTMA
jgi:hypothetical protein